MWSHPPRSLPNAWFNIVAAIILFASSAVTLTGDDDGGTVGTVITAALGVLGVLWLVSASIDLGLLLRRRAGR